VEPASGAIAHETGRHETCAMEPSDELRRVVSRFVESVRDGDEEAVSNRISRQPGFERFGSDPAEWWQEGEAATLVWMQQMREMGGGYPWRQVGDVHAMVEGGVGWAGLWTEFDGPTGPVKLRLTCVLHLEHGDWKIVQCHSSVPSTNEEHGFLLSTSVDDIAESVSASRPDLSGTSAADGTVTIAFTDIEDSTRFQRAPRRSTLARGAPRARRGGAVHHLGLRRHGGEEPGRRVHARVPVGTARVAMRTGDRTRDHRHLRSSRLRSGCGSASTWERPSARPTTSSVTP
jgi:hypothetical protein